MEPRERHDPRDPTALGEVADANGRRVRVADPAGDWFLGRHGSVDAATLDRVMRDLDGGDARTRAASLRTLRIGIAAVAVLLAASLALVAISIAVEGPAAFADLRASLLLTGPAIAMMVGAGVVAPARIVSVSRATHLPRMRGAARSVLLPRPSLQLQSLPNISLLW